MTDTREIRAAIEKALLKLDEAIDALRGPAMKDRRSCDALEIMKMARTDLQEGCRQMPLQKAPQ